LTFLFVFPLLIKTILVNTLIFSSLARWMIVAHYPWLSCDKKSQRIKIATFLVD
jgi:hypothetical protein